MEDPKSGKDQLLLRVRSVGVWYHVIELAPGVITPGFYDMRPFLPCFKFPKILKGRSVIDVGSSNGFFSFHFEELGAERVVAVDLETMADHDYPRWYVEQKSRGITRDKIEAIDRDELHAGFELAKEILGSRVEKRCLRVYELPEKLDEQFDFVFFGNVLEHLRDPVAALEALRCVLATDGLLVVSSPVDLSLHGSLAHFAGDPETVAWWIPGKDTLLNMCRMAGFTQVEWMGSFEIAPREQPDRKGVMAVVHCRK